MWKTGDKLLILVVLCGAMLIAQTPNGPEAELLVARDEAAPLLKRFAALGKIAEREDGRTALLELLGARSVIASLAGRELSKRSTARQDLAAIVKSMKGWDWEGRTLLAASVRQRLPDAVNIALVNELLLACAAESSKDGTADKACGAAAESIAAQSEASLAQPLAMAARARQSSLGLNLAAARGERSVPWRGGRRSIGQTSDIAKFVEEFGGEDIGRLMANARNPNISPAAVSRALRFNSELPLLGLLRFAPEATVRPFVFREINRENVLIQLTLRIVAALRWPADLLRLDLAGPEAAKVRALARLMLAGAPTGSVPSAEETELWDRGIEGVFGIPGAVALGVY